jgi:hypothetical protein
MKIGSGLGIHTAQNNQHGAVNQILIDFFTNYFNDNMIWIGKHHVQKINIESGLRTHENLDEKKG